MNALSVWEQSHRDELHPADAIVVLGAAEYDGAPSPIFQMRLDHALLLFRKKLAPLIVTTGGKEPGDIYTEAEVGEAYLQERGVPSSQLLTESSGRTSFESLANVARLAPKYKLHNILLVSDPLHSARIKQMASHLGFRSYTSPSSYLELNWSKRLKLRDLIKETVALTLYQFGLDRGPTTSKLSIVLASILG